MRTLAPNTSTLEITRDVRFRFDEPLESRRFAWFVHRGGRMVPFEPPAIGATFVLAPGPRCPFIGSSIHGLARPKFQPATSTIRRQFAWLARASCCASAYRQMVLSRSSARRCRSLGVVATSKVVSVPGTRQTFRTMVDRCSSGVRKPCDSTPSSSSFEAALASTSSEGSAGDYGPSELRASAARSLSAARHRQAADVEPGSGSDDRRPARRRDACHARGQKPARSEARLRGTHLVEDLTDQSGGSGTECQPAPVSTDDRSASSASSSE